MNELFMLQYWSKTLNKWINYQEYPIWPRVWAEKCLVTAINLYKEDAFRLIEFHESKE